jgi:hypothetical protein
VAEAANRVAEGIAPPAMDRNITTHTVWRPIAVIVFLRASISPEKQPSTMIADELLMFQVEAAGFEKIVLFSRFTPCAEFYRRADR